MKRNIILKKYYYICSVCGNKSFLKIYRVSLFNVCVCCICGVVCLNPRMDERGYINYYRNQYYNNYFLKKKFRKQQEIKKISREIKIFNDLKKYITKKSKIIEIGCGNGANLMILKGKGFNSLVGIEPAIECFKNLKKIENIKFFNQSLFEFTSKFDNKEKFDCVILSHILEHFVEPDKELKTIASLIKSGSILYILVPCIYEPKNPFSQFCIPHTFYFSEVTLKTLLEKSGFLIKKCFKNFNNGEITVIAEKSKKPLVSTINDLKESEKILTHLKKNNKFYIKAKIRIKIEELIIKIFGEEIYLYVRKFLKKILS